LVSIRNFRTGIQMPAMGKNTERNWSSSSKQSFKNPPARQAHGNGKEKSLSNGKESPKALLKTKRKGKAVPRSPSPAPVHSEEDEEGDYQDTDDSEDDGVDEEGMARLMQALGENGLDDMGRVQLEALAAGSGSENGGEEGLDGENVIDSEGSEVEGSGADEVGQLSDESSDDQEGEQAEPHESHDIAMDDASSVDEDAIPHQKVELDNKVCLRNFLTCFNHLSNFWRFR
jgi:rRNA-processing protein EBP2